MKIKKNGKVISLTESDLQRIVKEESKESLKMQGVDTGDDSIRNESTDLESRVSEIENSIWLFDRYFKMILVRLDYIEGKIIHKK